MVGAGAGAGAGAVYEAHAAAPVTCAVRPTIAQECKRRRCAALQAAEGQVEVRPDLTWTQQTAGTCQEREIQRFFLVRRLSRKARHRNEETRQH